MPKYVGPPISIVILLESVKDLKVKLFIHSNHRDKYQNYQERKLAQLEILWNKNLAHVSNSHWISNVNAINKKKEKSCPCLIPLGGIQTVSWLYCICTPLKTFPLKLPPIKTPHLKELLLKMPPFGQTLKFSYCSLIWPCCLCGFSVSRLYCICTPSKNTPSKKILL